MRYGLLWNWGAKVFESSLHPVKKAVRNSKVNAMVSLENYLLNWNTLYLFKSFSSELYQALGVSKLRADYFDEHLREKEEKKKQRRDGNVPMKFDIEGDTFFITSFNKKTHEPTEEIITTDSYSSQLQTNNQFVILQLPDKEVYVRVYGIDNKTNEVYYRRAVFVENPEIDIAAITNNYCVCISSWGSIEVDHFSNIKEKVVCFFLEGFWYATRIYR